MGEAHGGCDGGVEVCGAGFGGEDGGGGFVCFSVHGASFDAGSGEGEGERFWVVITACVAVDFWSTTKFGGDDD